MADIGLTTCYYLAVCRDPLLLKVWDRGRFDLNGLKPLFVYAFEFSEKGDNSAFLIGPFLPVGLVAVIARDRLLAI